MKTFFLSMRLFSAGNVVEGFNLAKKGILPLLLWQFYRSCRSERVAVRLFLNFWNRLVPHPLIQKSLRWMRCFPRSARGFSPAALTSPIYSRTLSCIRKVLCTARSAYVRQTTHTVPVGHLRYSDEPKDKGQHRFSSLRLTRRFGNTE